ncbi:MAG: GGDEF domain-containing protein [Sulfurimonas sp.]
MNINKYRQTVQKLGRIKTVSLITLFSVVGSVLLGYLLGLILKIFGVSINLVLTLFLSFIIPLIVAPLTSWNIIGLLFKIDDLEKEMRKLATFDPLTGLLNRQLFIDDAERYLKLARSENKDVAFLIIDIDNFKTINDTYGHFAGDAVLKSFGEVIAKTVRHNDLVARIGGEEFGVMLYDVQIDYAQTITKRLHKNIHQTKVIYENQHIPYTISIGLNLSNMGKEEKELHSLLKNTDKALYTAKEKGKNCTVIYSAAS